MSGDQKKKNVRQKLRQAHIAEVERTARDFVNLPAHGDREHLQTRNHEQALDLVKREIEMAEGGQPGMRVALGFGHVLLMCHRALE